MLIRMDACLRRHDEEFKAQTVENDPDADPDSLCACMVFRGAESSVISTGVKGRFLCDLVYRHRLRETSLTSSSVDEESSDGPSRSPIGCKRTQAMQLTPAVAL